jgi:flagellin
MERLSSGMRINRAADDAAGLSISEKMRSQIRGLKQASRNAQDGISLIQTAEGALNETHAILQRMRELTVQAGNLGTNQAEDLQAIQDELQELLNEIDSISERTAFNGKTLMNGEWAASDSPLTFQIGANGEQSMVLNIGDMSAAGLGLKGGAGALTQGTADVAGVSATVLQNEAGETVAVQVGSDWYAPENVQKNNNDALEAIDGNAKLTVASAGFVLGEATGVGINVASFTSSTDFDATVLVIDNAIELVSAERSKLGANQNRLEHTIANLNNAAENLQAAESRIRDLDMAEEIMAFTKNSILQQAATAMLAQANMAPQSVLQLLG